jgi:hypothetical protein
VIINNADWSVDVLHDGRRYWIQPTVSAHGRTERLRLEGPFRRQDQAEKAAHERLAETRRNLEDPIGPEVVATIRDLDA